VLPVIKSLDDTSNFDPEFTNQDVALVRTCALRRLCVVPCALCTVLHRAPCTVHSLSTVQPSLLARCMRLAHPRHCLEPMQFVG
jgi:hypothetical protein